MTHICPGMVEFEKQMTVRESPDMDGLIATYIIRISPVSKSNKIQRKTRFGIVAGKDDRRIVTGPQQFGWGFRLHYCPFCGENLLGLIIKGAK